MANIEVGLLETENQLQSMIESSGKTVPQPGERANIVDHLDYIIQLLGTMVSSETFEAAKEKMANGYNAINDRIDIVNYLLSSGEISGDIDVEPLIITENGEYVPGAGKAFGRVVVDTPINQAGILAGRSMSKFYDSSVTYIGPDAFAYCSELNELDLPNCESIFYSSSYYNYTRPFYSDSNLTKITLGLSSIVDSFYSRYIGYSMSNNTNLPPITDVTFPKCKVVGASAFMFCYTLSTFNGNNVEDIKNDAFYMCRSLAHLNIPKVSILSERAFFQCGFSSINLENLEQILPPSMSNIPHVKFEQCSALESLYLPNCYNISNNGKAIITNCQNLSEMYVGKVSIIRSGIFSRIRRYDSLARKWEEFYINNINHFSFPECEAVENCAFYLNYSMQTIDIPKCKVIGDSAFYSCNSLLSIDLPVCESIGDYAFAYAALSNISFPECISIGSSAFTGASNLSSIYLPKVEEIGSYAFAYLNYSGNKSLKVIDFPACKVIHSAAFGGCHYIESVNMPSLSLMEGSGHFSACSRLKTINMPLIEELPSGAFAYCAFSSDNDYYGLSNVSFPEVKKINDSAFYNCSALTDISFPKCVSLSGSYVFGYCSKLSTVEMPLCENVCASAFYGCSRLRSISLPNCKSVDTYGFAYCYNYSTSTGLDDIYLPLVEYIGERAFANAYMSEISFSKCKTIMNNAFAYCPNLNKVTLPICSFIGSSAFYNCSNLSSIYLLYSSVCTIESTNIIPSNKLEDIKVYVPESLYTYYQQDSVWNGISTVLSIYNE